MANKLLSAWFYPPLAFARVGGAAQPLDCFMWGPNDDMPRGTGKTTLVPTETLDMAADGQLSSRLPATIKFKEVVEGKERFRPACPWFELHGEWLDEAGQRASGPLSKMVLESCGVALDSLRFKVTCANKKAFNMTLRRSDIVEASVDIAWGDHERKSLNGTSKLEPMLALPERPLPMGAVQVARSNATFPEIRLRFFAPSGAVYAPLRVREKIADLLSRFPGLGEDRWDRLALPGSSFILNDAAAWSNWKLLADQGDERTVPVRQFAYQEGPAGTLNSLGLLDDFSDGLIRCEIGGAVVAIARVVVTPPDFAPDRRHVVNIADVLADRELRGDVAATYGDLPLAEFGQDMADIFERIYETLGLVNLDAMNTHPAFARGNRPPFAPPPSLPDVPLPLTQHARRTHRRLTAREALEDLLRERTGRAAVGSRDGYPPPRSLEDLFNAPPTGATGATAPGNSFRKMPALMRGSDGAPLHLTRRQYEALKLWIERLRA